MGKVALEEQPRTLGIIDVVADQGTYELEATTRPEGFDTDNDGIPDDWERANGLNPSSAADAKTKTLDPKGWYTNIEVYANSLVQDIMLGGNENAISSFNDYYPAFKTEKGVQIEAIETGIKAISNGALLKSSAQYNLQGQKVGNGYRGLIIKNGRKYLAK